MNAGTSSVLRTSVQPYSCLFLCCLLLLQLRLLFNHLRSSPLSPFCRDFFTFAPFGEAILVFFARFGAALYFFDFAFCSTTYVRPLSHLSLLGFVTFVFFTLRCHLFFIHRCHLFYFINSCAFSYYLSFLLPDEAFGRKFVISTACYSTVCCS